MARKKTTALKPSAEWKTLLTQASHQEAQNAGEVYRIKPVDLDTFVTSKDYLGQDLWGMSENQREFLEAATDLGNNINFFVLWVGKGGGKNWSVSVAFLYVVYQLLCMYDPHRYLNHNRDKAISLINVAINAPQANHNFFKPLTSILRHAGRKAFIDFGFNPDTDIQANMVLFPNNIQIISANSHAGGIEGYDILMALADEIDDVEFHGAERILDTLRTSARSRFSGKEKVMAISYRRYTGSSGKILELYNSAVGKQHIFARRYASWEFHPIRTRADFDTDFDENPEKAACIYGSIDTGSFVDSWIKDVKRLKSSFNLNRTWIFDWPLPYQVDEPGSESWWNKETHAEWRNSPMSEHSYHDDNGVLRVLDPYDMPIKYYGDSRYQYVFIGDPALGSEANGGDGYGLCLAHREIVKDERGNKHVRPVIDFAFRFTGRMFEEGQVQMKAVELLFKKLKERYGYNIKVASFDGWNCLSTGSLVLTPSGYKKVETLEIGEEVVGRNGINQVVAKEIKRDINTITIETNLGLKLTTTPNHPLLTTDGTWIEARNLKTGDKLALHDFENHFGTRETSVVSVTHTAADIVHMEVDGDHTYLGEGFINHNSASISQWIAKTYKDVIVYNSNLVEYQDYTVLRDCIFGEAPPSNGKGDRETNGGIDIPWHPILFEELRNLREDRCFTGDTRVRLLNGTTPTLAELADSGEEEFWVYSYDENNQRFIPAKAHSPRISYLTNKLTIVTLDDGSIIKCTPDHRFMLRDGSWCEAQHLNYGSSLKHLPIEYRKLGDRDYEYVKINNDWTPTHRWVIDSLLGRDARLGLTVHHINFNRYDNTPDNLELMKWSDHKQLHANLVNYNINHNDEVNTRRLNALLESEKSPERKALRRRLIKKAQSEYRKKFGRDDITLEKIKSCIEPGDNGVTIAQKLGCKPSLVYNRLRTGGADIRTLLGKPQLDIDTLLCNWEFNMSQEDLSNATGISKTGIISIVNNRWKEFKDNQDRALILDTYIKGMTKRELSRRLGCPWSTFHRRMNQLGITQEELETYNHKVISVETIDVEPTPMYDITVEGYENFLLENGHIIVHNSKAKAKVDHPETGGHTKDISDTVAKACRLLVYQWPFTEISTAGGSLVDDVKKKVANSVASDSEVESYNREINSNLVGLGSWRNMTNENSTIKLEDVIPNLDW